MFFLIFFKGPPSLFCIDVWGMFTLRIAFNFFTHLPLSAGIFIYLLLSIYWLNMGVLSLGLVIKNVPNVCFCGTSLRFFLGFYGQESLSCYDGSCCSKDHTHTHMHAEHKVAIFFKDLFHQSLTIKKINKKFNAFQLIFQLFLLFFTSDFQAVQIFCCYCCVRCFDNFVTISFFWRTRVCVCV